MKLKHTNLFWEYEYNPEDDVPEFGQAEQVEGFTEGETDTATEGGIVDLSTREEPIGRVGKIGKEQVQKAQLVLKQMQMEQ